MSAPQPAGGHPQRTVLEGRYVRLEPLAPAHAADLYEAAGPERYRWLPVGPPASAAALGVRIEALAQSDDPLAFAVIDRATGRCEGRQSYMRITPEHGVIEVGGILWGARMARTRLATEALFLFASYVFDDLGYRRFEWKCNALNEPSKGAALRFGFTYEGLFRQHMIVKGENRDTAWFAMLDGDWPRIKAGFEWWLREENFGADGMQKSKLTLA